METVQHVFLVGAKSFGAYGGYETFIDRLTEYHQCNCEIKYHVACKANGDGSLNPRSMNGVRMINEYEFEYHNAHSMLINVPEKIGPAQAIYYDCKAIETFLDYIEEYNIKKPIIYIMACRIGLFINKYKRRIKQLGGKLYINPDGHEWKRAKWSKPVRKYWQFSEKKMVKYADLVICDSINIEKYIHEKYDKKGIDNSSPATVYIAYGAEVRKSKLLDHDEECVRWFKEKCITPNEYYLVVGRFVPENNYETMICEFMKSNSKKDLAIITNVNDKFLEELEKRTGFKNDKRIKFVGTVYDVELLMKIREQAYGYLHGHEVGGTNPSLIEALGSTELNLLLKVGFNEEVGLDSAIYWTKNDGDLAGVIEKADAMNAVDRLELGRMAKERVKTAYSWQFICDRYAEIFLS